METSYGLYGALLLNAHESKNDIPFLSPQTYLSFFLGGGFLFQQVIYYTCSVGSRNSRTIHQTVDDINPALPIIKECTRTPIA